jgi:L-methionine (R)-S-oxide reductase
MGSSDTRRPLEAWLEAFVRDHGGVAGTVHVRFDGGDLELAAALNIPEKVQEIVRRIPKGKGMAGLAWERDEAVSTCNIQSDASTDVRPGARAVDAQAGVAIPVHDVRGEVRAVVGIAYREERTLGEAELAALVSAAALMPGN